MGQMTLQEQHQQKLSENYFLDPGYIYLKNYNHHYLNFLVFSWKATEM